MEEVATTKPIALSAEQVQELTQRVIWCVQSAEDDLSDYRDDVETQRELFDPRPERAASDKPWTDPAPCELHVARCEWTVQRTKAEVRKALFDINPIFKIEPRTEKDRVAAAAVERFGQLLLVDYMQAADDLIRSCEGGFRDGSEGVYVRWRKTTKERTVWETELVPVEVPITETQQWVIDPLTGEKIQRTDTTQPDLSYEPYALQTETVNTTQTVMIPERRPVRKPFVIYDGPEYIRVEVTRLGTYPAADSDVSKSPILFIRYSEDWDTILQRVKAGEYDRDVVEELRSLTPETTYKQTAEDLSKSIESTADASRTRQWEPLDLIEAWVGYVPTSDSKKNVEPEVQDMTLSREFVLTIHEGTRKALRCIENPRWDGERPIEVIMPRDARKGVYGLSVPDLVGDVQAMETTAVRRMFDRLDKDLRPPVIGEWGSIEPEKIREENRPGGILQTYDPKSVQFLQDNGASAQTVLPLLDWANTNADRAGGVGDPTLGIMPPGERTLGEVQITTDKGDILHQLIISNCARSLARIWKLTLNSAYQCIANDSMQKLWLQANPNIEPQSPDFLPGEWELHPDRAYKISCWGVAEDANRMQNRQKWAYVGKDLLNDPDVISDPSTLYAAKSDYYTAMGLDATRYLGDEDTYVERKTQEMQQMQQMQEAAMQQQAGMQEQAMAQEQQKAGMQMQQAEMQMQQGQAQGQQKMEMAAMQNQQKMQMADMQNQLKMQIAMQQMQARERQAKITKKPAAGKAQGRS